MREKIVPPFLLGLAACLVLPAAARAQDPELLLGNGESPLARLTVGDDLWVGMRGGEPGACYEFRLLGPGGDLIAELAAEADAAGNVAGGLLWPASGVVGCDCGVPADHDNYRFVDFEAAESQLDGQELLIEAVDAAGGAVAAAALPAAAVEQEERAYFSDQAGCPRSRYAPGEPVWLSLLHPDHGQPARLLFLAASRTWPLGQPIDDVRGAPQALTLPAGAGRPTLAVGLGGDPGPSPLAGLLRRAHSGSVPTDPMRRQLDRLVAAPFAPNNPNGGITISLDTCVAGGPPH